MNISSKGLSLIKEHEGLSLTAYLCPAGILTIGYGHTGPDVISGKSISMAMADCLLHSDVRFAVKKVNELVKSKLSQNQFDALTSLIYNIGAGNFKKSTLLKKVNSDPSDRSIEVEFKRWIYSGSNILPGLVKRREAEAKLYFS